MNSLSIVIPTLGSESLFKTIKNLNCGAIIPNEILICIPNDLAHKVVDLKFDNVKIILTERYGQVYQRLQGFKSASFDFVLQLDDDIELDPHCLALMLETLKNLPVNSAVCPVYFENEIKKEKALVNHKFYQKLINPSNLFRKFFNLLVHGNFVLKDGIITKASVNVHFDPSNKNDSWYLVSWLPGGCVLHHKINLCLEDYFIYPGKAYCEDIIHSHLLRLKGINLYVSNYSFCIIDLNTEILGLSTYKKVKYIFNEFRARLLYTKKSKSSVSRLLLFYFSIYFHLPFTYLKNRIK
jgi:glycosyltransferase involved in cell wall biosynthesis